MFLINVMYYIRKKKKEKDPTKKVKTPRKQSLSTLVNKLDKVFSLYIRLRDSKQYNYKYFRCISCGQVKPFEQCDCGHYVGRMHMNTRFDEHNCNSECKSCNRFSADHIIGYRRGLIRKIGEQNVDLLELRGHQTRKWSTWELEQLITYYTAIVKTMEKERDRYN